MKVLIGSMALKDYIDIGREPKDIDYFSDQTFDKLESVRIEPFYHPDLKEYFSEEPRIATFDELYTIKFSHIFWDLRNGSWEKHARDIMLMQKSGAKLIEPLYKLLYGVWKEVHGDKKANLSQGAKDFFNDKVVRKYVHDSIHASVAYYDAPLYERILADGEEVKVDKSKWDALSFEDKLKCVREEVYATALERLIIPSGYTYSPRRAYAWALRRTVTSLARGWFALFIAEHLEDVWSPGVNYVQVHKNNSDKLILLGEEK